MSSQEAGRIMIRCPKTGKALPTGLELSRQIFENAQIANNEVQCPHCNSTHTWAKEDAFIETDTD